MRISRYISQTMSRARQCSWKRSCHLRLRKYSCRARSKHSAYLRRMLCSRQEFYQRTGDVSDGDVRFLDALRILRRYIEEQVDFAGKRATSLSGKRNQKGATRAACFDAAEDVRTCATG